MAAPAEPTDARREIALLRDELGSIACMTRDQRSFPDVASSALRASRERHPDPSPEAAPMRLFHWDTLDTCRNYSDGDAVVMAPDLASARAVLKERLEAWCAENREWEWTHSDDPDDRARLEARIAADVAGEPHAVHDGASGVVLRGSE